MQENILKEEIRRGKETEHDVVYMYKAYLGARMFEKAASFKKQFPGIVFPFTPETIVSGNPTDTALWRVYNISDNGNKAELKVLSMEAGPKVIIAMLPGCSAAEAAMTQIMADPELSAAFIKHGVLITASFDAQGVVQWRDRFNFPEVYIVNKTGDFPGFDFSRSPNFYFLKDRKILSHFSGWSRAREMEKNKTAFRKGLATISISSATLAYPDKGVGP